MKKYISTFIIASIILVPFYVFKIHPFSWSKSRKLQLSEQQAKQDVEQQHLTSNPVKVAKSSSKIGIESDIEKPSNKKNFLKKMSSTKPVATHHTQKHTPISNWFKTHHVLRSVPRVSEHKILQRAPDLSPKVLHYALTAFYRAYQRGLDNKEILTVIDYSKPSSDKRMWVIDVAHARVLFHTLVAHGSGSGQLKAVHFSNRSGTHQSSLGVFLTGATYRGGHGVSLKLHGLEPGINDAANARHVVFHGAHYVSESFVKLRGYLGRSWGCPALDTRIATKVIQTIKNGTLVFAYYPQQTWLRHSHFLS
ncbi:MAG: hypothetical protein Tsb005_16550 [Gammaproteobacteria bacterium]